MKQPMTTCPVCAKPAAVTKVPDGHILDPHGNGANGCAGAGAFVNPSEVHGWRDPSYVLENHIQGVRHAAKAGDVSAGAVAANAIHAMLREALAAASFKDEAGIVGDLKAAAAMLKASHGCHTDATQEVFEAFRALKAANQATAEARGGFKALGSNDAEREAILHRENPGPLARRRLAEDVQRQTALALEQAKADWALACEIARVSRG